MGFGWKFLLVPLVPLHALAMFGFFPAAAASAISLRGGWDVVGTSRGLSYKNPRTNPVRDALPFPPTTTNDYPRSV